MSDSPSDAAMMRAALAVARSADSREVPVGAVVFDAAGQELARASNAREVTGDPTAHAEMLALQAAATAASHWQLPGATLVVTLEPCTMCAGAALSARVGRLLFGAWEPKTGAAGSVWDVVRDRRLSYRPEVSGGVLESECAALLAAFFTARRQG